MSTPGLYEQVLAHVAAGESLPAPKPPRASAAIVPWRYGSDGHVEVFWVRRARTLKFMAGFHAFPGGGVSKADAQIAIAGWPGGLQGAPSDGAMPASVTRGLGELEEMVTRRVVVAALRELYEETGLLLAAGRLDRGWLEDGRRRLESREVGFADLLAERTLTLDASRLVYAGRWLTPPLGPLRFDNRFFLLHWPESEGLQPTVVVGELDRGEWRDAAQALELWQSGDITTAPPILHLLRVLAEDGPERGLERLHAPREANLGPHRIIEFRPGVLLFPLRTPTLPPAGHTNAFLLGTEEAVLVDPGSPFEVEIEGLHAALRAARDKLGRRVTQIWLTHHHPDHVGGVEAMRRRLGVPVLAHETTAERLRESGIAIDGHLEEGQRVVLTGEAPLSLRVLHTPGHARGHLAFLDETRDSLIAGDVVAGVGTIVIDPPEGDMEAYLETLARLRDLNPAALFPSHGPPTTRGAQLCQEYIDHRLWRERRVLDAWSSGLRTPAEMLPTVYDDVPKLAYPLAERQILAHLERLRSQGALASGA